MPGRAERIYLFTPEADQPCRVMDFPIWWDRREFFDRYRNRQVDLNHPVYVDYAFLLAPWEALEWDKLCREKFYPDSSSKNPRLVSDMHQLQLAVNSARWVIVESYEWESGLE